MVGAKFPKRGPVSSDDTKIATDGRMTTRGNKETLDNPTVANTRDPVNGPKTVERPIYPNTTNTDTLAAYLTTSKSVVARVSVPRDPAPTAWENKAPLVVTNTHGAVETPLAYRRVPDTLVGVLSVLR